MKLYIYYILVIIPLVFIYFVSKQENDTFIYLLFFYALVYRPVLDALKLITNNIISKDMIYKVFIPFWRIRFYKELYFN